MNDTPPQAAWRDSRMSTEIIKGFELSPQQKRLWALQKDLVGPYRGRMAILIEGSLDRERLRSALETLVARYEVLRTSFQRAPGLVLPLQVIEEPEPLALPLHDFRGVTEELQRELWLSLLRELEAAVAVDRSPVLRACLAELAPGRHLLLLALPAMSADAATLDRLALELSASYRRGGDGSEPEEPLQYADLAQWQNELLESDAAKGAVYWRPFDLPGGQGGELPFELRPGAAGPFAPASVASIGPAGLAAVQDLAEQAGVAVSAVLLAGWQALLARLGAGHRLVVGTLFDGRGHEDLASALGLFSKLLPVASDVDPAEPFESLVRRTGAVLKQHRDWQDLFKPQAAEGGEEPRFFSFSFEHQPEPPAGLPGEPRFSVLELAACTERFKLKLLSAERSGSLRLELQYDPAFYDRARIVAVAGHLETLMTHATREPRARIEDLHLLDEAMRHRLARELNDTGADFGFPEPLLHAPFELQARVTPDATALEYEGGALTYGELDSLADRLANHLHGLGVGPERRVAVCLEPSPETVIALLAVLKAGGAYVPLDPAFPRERLHLMLRDSGAAVLLTREAFLDRLPGSEASRILLEPGWPDRLPVAPGPPPHRPDPDGAAYVIFTSGSTGTPKGTVVSHRAICNRLLWMIAAFRLDAGDRFVQKTPFIFDASIWEFFVPLWIGAPLVLARPGGHQDPPYLLQLLKEREVTVLQMVPSLLQLLAQDGGLAAVSSLRYVFSGGEALSFELERRVFAQTPARLVNLYGPTEAAIDATSWGCDRESTSRVVPIGRPIANDQVYVVDPGFELVPPGVPGELWIGGVGLARGYLERQDLTAERFVPDPFGSLPGARLYRTGDLARVRPGGEIEVIGRIDHQVKVRGLRIELGEIEAVLARQSAVRQAVVVAREDVPGDLRLVAYLVADPERMPMIEDLRGFLAERLPEYMVPSAFVVLEELPRLPNGKLDRRALPAPDGSRPSLRKPYVAPRNETERRLAGIWSAVLGVREIGVEDNFFELGGDSILSIQIVSRAREAGLRIAPRDLFQHQTVASLAAVAGAPAQARAAREVVSGPVPLTPIQHDFFERDLTHPHRYNQSLLLEVRQPLSPAACEALLADLLVRHDALRLRFVREGALWRQRCEAPDDRVPFGVADLSPLPQERRRAAIEQIADSVHDSLDLSAGPLIRGVLLLAGPGENGRLLLVIHHLAVDGVSWRILLDDLKRGRDALTTAGPVPSPAATTSFRDWAERLVAQSPALRGEIDHWVSEHRHGPVPLPVDFPEVPGTNLEAFAETVSALLEPEETRSLLTRIPEVHRASLNEALLAALAEALTTWTGGRPPLVDLEGHGREEISPDVDLSRTVGWFTSVYPVLLETGPVRGPVATLRAVREKLRSLPGHGIGYGILRYLDDDPGTRERMGSLPRARVGFNYLGQIDQVLAEGGPFGAAPEPSGRGQSLWQSRRYLLEVTALVTEGRLVVSWSFSRRIHRRETIERLSGRFLQALRGLLAEAAAGRSAGHALADFPLVRSLDAGTLEQLAADALPLEDLYPLSPLQQGLLFDVVRSPRAGAYVQQISCHLSGPLAPEPFARAWQQVVDHHSILRTGFLWEGLEEPLQVVRRAVALPWQELDWTGLAPEEQAERLERFLEEDRVRGFDVGRPPLMRLALLRLAEDRHELVWTSHHLVLDGWSVPLIVAEIVSRYEALRAGREPEPGEAIPYRRYIDWLLRQDLGQAESYWRRALYGFRRPTPIGRSRGAAAPGGGHRQKTLQIPQAVTAGLKALVQRRQLTLNILVQGLWALLLSRLSDSEDLVFGIVVSGRPTTLAESGAMVGMFVNTIPVRVRLEPSTPFLDWLERLQTEQAEARQHEQTPLVALRGWSEVPPSQPLFESTFAFNNYPTTDALSREGSAFGLAGVRWQEQTSYPLDFTVGLGAQLAVRVMYDSGRIDPADVEDLAAGLEALLNAVLEQPDRTVGDFVGFQETLGKRRKAAQGESAVIDSPMFKKVKPKTVSLPTSEVVSRSYLDPEGRLPLVIQPAGADVDLAGWAESHKDLVESELARHGAILFRGFGIETPPVFERFAAAVCSELFNENGEHPRESVSGNVYTPVFYPAEKQLLWHNENSFNHRWPAKILFCCVQPAEQGGETPIVDSRRVFEGVDPEVRAAFLEKGILYVRNYGEGVGLDWQTVFRTNDRAKVEEQCRADRMEFEWKDGNRLKTMARRPAVIAHPRTGEMSWFNQAQHWHVSCLDEATRESVRSLFAEDDLPRNCYYGDGTPIPDSVMAHILEVYRRLESCSPWRKGDVMLVDNVLAAHGRNEYVGRRKLLVALGDMMSFAE